MHLSDVDAREEWRRRSVISDLVAAARVSGKGPDGYREALELLAGQARRRAPCGGMSAFDASRATGSRSVLEELGLDLLLVNHLVNVRYLTRLHRDQRRSAWSGPGGASS